jgi:NAD(P)-dependent dehydrogenase (short-subunit alcohol dehydrogenase family)
MEEVSAVAREMKDDARPALAVRCDVLHRCEVEDMVAHAEAALGPVDLLVNNAGQFGPVGPIATTDPDQWWQTLEVNLRGPLYCARAVLPGMLSRGRGRIINVSTSVARAGFRPKPVMKAREIAAYRVCECGS